METIQEDRSTKVKKWKGNNAKRIETLNVKILLQTRKLGNLKMGMERLRIDILGRRNNRNKESSYSATQNMGPKS